MKTKKTCDICGEDSHKLMTHIVNKHGMDPKDYYDKYLLKESIICKLDGCINSCKFIKFSAGYREFCSVSCSMKYRYVNSDLNLVASERLKNLHKSDDFSKDHSLRCSKRMKSNSTEYHKLRFIKLCEDRDITNPLFYIKIYDTYLKIGITTGCPAFHIKLLNKDLNSYELFSGSVRDIAELEKEIKTEFKSIKGAEYFDLKDYDSIKSKLLYTIEPFIN